MTLPDRRLWKPSPCCSLGKVNNEAYRYDGYKDLNDYLRGKDADPASVSEFMKLS